MAPARPGRRQRSAGENARRKAEFTWRRLTASRRALPDFVVIGAQRSGTTSLYRTLREHPEIEPSFRKEVHYFDLSHRKEDLNWYRAHFGFPSSRIQGEATPNYLAFAGVPERMHAVIPRAKLVVLVRDPVERAHSAWRYKTRDGSEKRSFSDAIREEAADGRTHAEKLSAGRLSREDRAMLFSYLEKGRYAEHLERWLRLYSRDQLHITKSEDLFATEGTALRSLVEFLGADPEKTPSYTHANVTPPADMEPADRTFLREYFASHNRALEEIMERELGWT